MNAFPYSSLEIIRVTNHQSVSGCWPLWFHFWVQLGVITSPTEGGVRSIGPKKTRGPHRPSTGYSIARPSSIKWVAATKPPLKWRTSWRYGNAQRRTWRSTSRFFPSKRSCSSSTAVRRPLTSRSYFHSTFWLALNSQLPPCSCRTSHYTWSRSGLPSKKWPSSTLFYPSLPVSVHLSPASLETNFFNIYWNRIKWG